MTTLLFISGGEIVIVVLVILLLFGSKKIPDFARTFGKGMNEFKKATEEIKREINETSNSFTEEIDDVRESLNDQVEDMHDTFSETTGEDYDPYGVEDQPYPKNEDVDDISENIEIANANLNTEKSVEAEEAEKPDGANVKSKEGDSSGTKTKINKTKDQATEDLPKND